MLNNEIKKCRISNPNASDSAVRLYEYLCGIFGKKMLTAQQESVWVGSPDKELKYIKETTGKLPAIRGLDFIDGDFDGVVSRAKAWHGKGGIVTICWHTGLYGGGYTECKENVPDFDKLLTTGTDEHKAMLQSWDKAAEALAELRDCDIPVLWRPFHEFDGGWFWWGKGGSESFIKLWRLMYDYFTHQKGLNNLIWVLGYADFVLDGWYPGDGYCDIIGSDTYNNSPHKAGWDGLKKLGTDKPMTFHECGNVPPIEDFERDGAFWLWFMIWHTEFIFKNDKENLKRVYNSEKAVTLDRLPKL